MTTLFEAIQAEIGAVFGAVYLDGTLHKVTLIDDGKGSYLPPVYTDIPIKGMVDMLTEGMRQQAGFSEEDARLVILQAGVDQELGADDQVTLRGKRWNIHQIEDDPAQGGWVMRGTPA